MSAVLAVNAGVDPEQVRAQLDRLATATRKESGCSLFEVFQDQGDPRKFYLWEKFEDVAALDRHMEEEYTRAYFSQRLTSLVSSTRLVPVSLGDRL